MLTISEFKGLAREIKSQYWWLDCFLPGGTGDTELDKLLLEYTDLSSEDIERTEELDREYGLKIETE